MSGSFDCSSPFTLSAGDSAALEQHNEALRPHRRGNVDSSSLFCPFHREECSEQQRADFQLHRDVVAALILPLFEIHRQATQIATRVLGRRQATEPERAFRGEARGAFAWLHCILTEEREFCLAQGCPACVVLHVLSSEPTIRLVTMACLLCEIVSSAEYTDFTQTHLLRPNFNCWLHAMESAVRADSLWGDLYWPEIRHRAESLAVDIRYLILQCVELRNGSTELQRTSSTTSITSACGSTSTSTSTGCSGSGSGSTTSNKPSGSMAVRSDRQSYRVHMRSAIPLQPSALARRQLNMVWEEQELVSRFLQGYWGSLCWSDRRQKMLEFSKTGSLYLPGKTT